MIHLDRNRSSHRLHLNKNGDAPTKSSVLYNAANKLRRVPNSDDTEGVFRIWDPKEESQSIDENLKREEHEKQV